MADGHYGGGHSISDGTPCKSGSIEVSSPTFAPFICEAGRPCDMCLRYYQSKTAATAKATEMKLKASASQSGASSGSPEESQKPLSESSELMSISSSSDASLSGSQANLPQGMETKECGGVDHKTEERCHHGKRPMLLDAWMMLMLIRLLCWDGSNTGRHYLAYPLKGKSNMCDFVSWVDDKWPPMFWEVVGKFKKQADDLQVDLLETIQIRNDVVEEKEALLGEKQELLLEKQRLEREISMRTRLAQSTCTTLQNRISNDVHEKKMLFGAIMCMIGLVAILFGIILKK
ncbi:hypothetical protein PAHAL_5G355900 [Panicum hallii]|uniref:Uncharacterized protein n=1 Tax=Panicum hallii TaxID=206008 RepID=A0A2T8IMA0_9POAL|nr:hypothetical protein PAHAL_5G355900 [Panicum hallii]